MSEIKSSSLMENELLRNEHVKELVDTLKANGKDAGTLVAMIGYVGSMESQLNRAAEDLQAVMVELNAMREERNHPLRTAMQNAAHSMERNISEARTQLGAIKTQIIEGCKQAMASFKQHGISALDSVARFFKIKPALQTLRSNLRSDIKKDQATISKIKAISTQYHKAGRSIHNFGRALQGKKPIPGVKPNGKLAALVSAPFHSEIKALTNAVKSTDKAIAALTRLEKSVPKKTPPKKAAERDDKPSVKETMKQLAEKIAQDKKETPAIEKSKHRVRLGIGEGSFGNQLVEEKLYILRNMRDISDRLLDILTSEPIAGNGIGRKAQIIWELTQVRDQAAAFARCGELICWLETSENESRLCAIPKDLDRRLYNDLWSGGVPTIFTSGTLSAYRYVRQRAIQWHDRRH